MGGGWQNNSAHVNAAALASGSELLFFIIVIIIEKNEIDYAKRVRQLLRDWDFFFFFMSNNHSFRMKSTDVDHQRLSLTQKKKRQPPLLFARIQNPMKICTTCFC